MRPVHKKIWIVGSSYDGLRVTIVLVRRISQKPSEVMDMFGYFYNDFNRYCDIQ